MNDTLSLGCLHYMIAHHAKCPNDSVLTSYNIVLFISESDIEINM